MCPRRDWIQKQEGEGKPEVMDIEVADKAEVMGMEAVDKAGVVDVDKDG